MASRSRARSFALQMLYCADVHADGFANWLYQLEQKTQQDTSTETITEEEKEYVARISLMSSAEWAEEKKSLVQKEYVAHLKDAMMPLFYAQLELPEEWFHEQRFHDPKDIEQYRMLLEENIHPMDAFHIVTDKQFSEMFHFFCAQILERLEVSEDFAPGIIAHWLLHESQIEELINLEIDWNPLYDTLCLLQMGVISDLSARILLKRIRKEYDPNNKNERKTAKELAIGNKGKSLLVPKAVSQDLMNEVDGQLNEDMSPAEPEEMAYADFLVQGVSAHISHLDTLIAHASTSWEIDRMSMIDRNILRLGSFELVYQESLPSRVVINEAINLTKCFSGSAELHNNRRGGGYSDGVKFVNGILDKIARDIGKSDLAKGKSR